MRLFQLTKAQKDEMFRLRARYPNMTEEDLRWEVYTPKQCWAFAVWCLIGTLIAGAMLWLALVLFFQVGHP